MSKLKFNELSKHYNEEVVLKGFIDNLRDLQYVQFIVLRDRTGKIQVTVEKNEENKELNEIVSNLPLESVIKVTGKLLESPKVKLNGMEVIPTKIEVLSKSENELPINYKDKESSLIDTRLDYRFLDLRNEKNVMMFKVQSAFVEGMRNYLYEQEFTEIHTPKLIAAASESGSDVFEVKYFENKAYLAQSPQFYKQMAMAAGFEKVFEVAPAFRAENSNTNRHTTEFTSFDLEFSYIEDFTEVMDLEEEMLIAGLTNVKEKYGDKIKEMFNEEIIIPTRPFPRIKLQDLYKELESRYGYNIPKEDVGDMNAEAEN